MFISRDPIGLMGGMNNFQYAPNPVGWVDPLGLMEVRSYKYHDNSSKYHFVFDKSKFEKKYTKKAIKKLKLGHLDKAVKIGLIIAQTPPVKPNVSFYDKYWTKDCAKFDATLKQEFNEFGKADRFGRLSRADAKTFLSNMRVKYPEKMKKYYPLLPSSHLDQADNKRKSAGGLSQFQRGFKIFSNQNATQDYLDNLE